MSEDIKAQFRRQGRVAFVENFSPGLLTEIGVGLLDRFAFDDSRGFERLDEFIEFTLADGDVDFRGDDFAHALLQSAERTVDRFRGPRLSARIAEQFAGGVLHHQSTSNLQTLRREIDDPRSFLALRFPDLEHPAFVGQVDVGRLYPQDFLRSTSGLEGNRAQIDKPGVGDEGEHPLEFLCPHEELSSLGSGNFHVVNRILLDVTLLACPGKAAFDRPHVISPGCLCQLRVGINPLLHMVRADIHGLQIGIALAESLDAVTIPLVGIRATLPLRPVQKRISNSDKGLRRHFLRSRLPHESIEAIKRFLFVRPKIVPLSVDRHEPRLPVLAEPRFRSTCHKKNPPVRR